MKKLTALMKNLLNDESGQGATEYVLLVVVVVALVVIFRDKITSTLRDKVEQLGGDIMNFQGGAGGN